MEAERLWLTAERNTSLTRVQDRLALNPTPEDQQEELRLLRILREHPGTDAHPQKIRWRECMFGASIPIAEGIARHARFWDGDSEFWGDDLSAHIKVKLTLPLAHFLHLNHWDSIEQATEEVQCGYDVIHVPMPGILNFPRLEAPDFLALVLREENISRCRALPFPEDVQRHIFSWL